MRARVLGNCGRWRVRGFRRRSTAFDCVRELRVIAVDCVRELRAIAVEARSRRSTAFGNVEEKMDKWHCDWSISSRKVGKKNELVATVNIFC